MEQLTLLDFVEPRRQPANLKSNTGFIPLSEGFQLQYRHPHGCLYQGDSIDWLASLDNWAAAGWAAIWMRI